MRSGGTKCDYIKTKKKTRGFNFRRSVSREESGPCGCQRLGGKSVNHGTQPTSPELQLRLFECSLNWNTVDVRERSMTLLGGPVRTPSRCFVFNKYKTPPNSSESHQQVPQDRAFTQTRSQIRTFSVVCGKDNVVIILKTYPFHAVKACFWYYLGSLQQRFKLDLK